MSTVSLELIQAMLERVLEDQRRQDAALAEIRTGIVQVKEPLGFLEQHYASISCRVDRLGGDVEQIRRRLDLVDAPTL